MSWWNQAARAAGRWVNQADRALGGWVPGGGVPNPLFRPRPPASSPSSRPRTTSPGVNRPASSASTVSRSAPGVNSTASIKRSTAQPVTRPVNRGTDINPISSFWNTITGLPGAAYQEIDRLSGGVLPDAPGEHLRSVVDFGLTRAGIRSLTNNLKGLYGDLNSERRFSPVPFDKIRHTLDHLNRGSSTPITIGGYTQNNGAYNPRDNSIVGPGKINAKGNLVLHGDVWLHEMGHALNNRDPHWRSLQADRFRNLNPATERAGIGLNYLLTRDPENASYAGAAVTGAVNAALQPRNILTLIEEGKASLNAAKLAREHNYRNPNPYNLGALRTYAQGPLVVGGVTGVVTEAGARGIDSIVKTVTDNIFQHPDGKYTDMEEKLRPYGYDRNQYRFKPERNGILPSFSGNVVIQPRN